MSISHNTKNISVEERKHQATIIHNGKYDYTLWPDYVHRRTKVTIICPEHDTVFVQVLDRHLKGFVACEKCTQQKKQKNKKVSTNEYILKMAQKHNGKYDYSLVSGQITSFTKINIICPIHGNFTQRVHHHVAGSGCQKCARLSTSIGHYSKRTQDKLNDANWLKIQHTKKSLIEIAKDLNVSDSTVGKKMREFNIPIKIHAQSSLERECVTFLRQLGISNIVTNDRKLIPPREIDIFLPDFNVGIELCGLYWHSDIHRPKNYHKDKFDACTTQGIKLLTIFEDEWINKFNIVKNKIAHILKVSDQEKVYARNTEIIHVDRKIKKEFFNKFHIQGNGPSSVNYALKLSNGDICAILSFIKKNKTTYILNRYATSCSVVGGFSKLLKQFEQDHSGVDIITFADSRWSNGDLYINNGFELNGILPPDYSYFSNGSLNREHKFNYRRSLLQKKLAIFDPNLTEMTNCDNNNILRIWDCGKIRFKKILKQPQVSN